MSGSGSYYYSYSGSGSLSTSSDVDKDPRETMWSQITRIPMDLVEKTDNFMYVEKVLSLVAKYDFSLDDPHMRRPEDTTKIGRLLKLVSAQCSKKIAGLSKELSEVTAKAGETESFLQKKVELQNTELARLRRLESRLPAGASKDHHEGGDDGATDGVDALRSGSASLPEQEMRRLKVENDLLSTELRKVTRVNAELKESLEARRREQTQTYGDSDKLHLEYKHLVARHSRLVEKARKTEEILTELRQKEKSKHQSTDTELERLRDKIKVLQQENLTLIDSRDRAEELCEKREAEAFRDMTELRRLTKNLIEEERNKVRQIREEYAALKDEADAHVEQLLQQHDEDMKSKEEEIVLLRRQLEKATSKPTGRRFNEESSSASGDSYSYENSSTTDASSSHTSSRGGENKKPKGQKKPETRSTAAAAVQRKLERENDDLQAEIEELEVRVDAMEEENRRLTRLVKDYEGGDEGLLHLRHELSDATRTVEVLQDENAQLRERLNGMEDSLAFTAALQELCKRMGVTEEEINSLKPQNAAAYSEMDTLKEEVNVLKEEVEWLEKERRMWMNKVRLQPLMDTKLRFELGLTSEQLRQLDNLVDQMKAGNLVIEDNDASYKEKYFKELEARRKDAAQFNEYVRERIEEALRNAFGGDGGAGDGESASALTALRDHIDLLTNAAAVSAGDGTGGKDALTAANELTRRQLREQLDSARRQIEQLTLSAKDNMETISQLRERLAAASAESDLVAKERDQFRDAIFAAAGARRGTRGGDGSKPSRNPSQDANPAEGSHDVAGDSSITADPQPDDEESASFLPAHGPTLGAGSRWAALADTLRGQLKAKDELIQSLNERLSELHEKFDSCHNDAAAARKATEAERRVQEELKDQLGALREINEDLNAKNRELHSMNVDLQKGMSGLDDSSKTKELLQKVVLLRRREAKLLTRLRRAITAQEAAVAAEKKLQLKMDHSFASLREALEGTSTGFVLPPSSASHGFEEEQLGHLHSAVRGLLNGKLFREDSRYLIHLQQVYRTMESNQEASALRLREKDHLKTIDALNLEVDALKSTITELKQQQMQGPEHPPVSRASGGGVATGPTGGSSPETGGFASSSYGSAAASKWESESVMWRQKYELCYKRLEAKDAEVALLEKELDTTRQEIVDVKDHVRNMLSGTEAAEEARGGAGAHDTSSNKQGMPTGGGSAILDAGKLARYEREVARLKSINLGLLNHTLDLQGNVRSLEVELEAREQELTLLKDAGNGELINDFVSAAVREHAALRRQSELALIQARRMKIQLAATEANYQVVANEATAYKLSAYRLYRRYVDEMVGVVDYVRCVQRASKGALSAHRAEIMDQRFQRLAAELEEVLHHNKDLTVNLSDKSSLVTTLEQQLHLAKLPRGSVERQDAMEARLREARAAAREDARKMAECQEDEKHAEGKVLRLEAYVKQLTDEIARLEFGALSGVSPLDDELLQSLRHLKETVFAKAEAPPLAISGGNSGGTRDRTDDRSGGGPSSMYRAKFLSSSLEDDPDVAVREYKAAVVKQKELASQCEELRRELTGKTKETERLAAVIADQKDMITRLEEKSAFYQKQLDEDRCKAEVREERMKRAHETQAEVSRRAMEHNAQCLRDMVAKKEAEISELREQLNAERRRYLEQQLEEAARMERVHEGMFRENNAMVERFRVAINSVGDNLLAVKPPLPGEDAQGDVSASVLGQLQYLTAETIRLQRELELSRATNIALETQLSQQVSEAQRHLRFPTLTQTQPQEPSTLWPGAVPSAQPPTQTISHPQGAPADSASAPTPVPPGPSVGSPDAAPPSSSLLPSQAAAAPFPAPVAAEEGGRPAGYPVPAAPVPPRGAGSGSVDALSSIVKSQSAMIESLRQREAAMSNELQLEKQHHAEAQRALQELRMRHVEKEGALQLVSQVSNTATDPAPMRELRAQLARSEQELKDTRDQLERERAVARQLQSDASAWKEHLDQLSLQVANQQAEVDRARTLATLNEGLQHDVNALKDQNDKLMTASSLLKQRLLDEARRGGDVTRQQQHEIALAQRMGSLQQESAEHVKVLDRRIKDVQRELHARAAQEADMRAKNDELQRTVYQLHQQLRAKDRELAAALAPAPHRGGRSAGGDKATQVLSTVSPAEQPGARVFSASGLKPLSPVPSTNAEGEPPAAAPPAKPAEASRVADLTTTTTTTTSLPGDPPAVATVAAAVTREVRKAQRDQLHQLSLLRSTVGRLEKDLAEAREHLKGERDAARGLRTQLAQAKKAAEEAHAQFTRDLAEAHRHRSTPGVVDRLRSPAPAQGTTGVSSPSPASPVVADELVAQLRQRVAELEPMAAKVERLQQELAELRASHPTSSPPSLGTRIGSAPPADARHHVQTLVELERVNDDLRRQVQVVYPGRINELQAQRDALQKAVSRLLEAHAIAKGVSQEQLRVEFGIPDMQTGTATSRTEDHPRTVEQLESEILAKNNALLDLRFTQETLELRVSRLQRHLDDLMAVDALQAKTRAPRSHQDRVEALEAVIANLQLIIQALQRENADLKTQATLAARYPEIVREVKQLRQREKDLQTQLAQLSARTGSRESSARLRPAAPSHDRTAQLQERLVAAQASADTYHAELESLRLRLEAKLPTQRRGDGLPAPGADQRRVEPLLESAEGPGLPRLGSGRLLATQGDSTVLPPPLPPAAGPHSSMRHHHIPRK